MRKPEPHHWAWPPGQGQGEAKMHFQTFFAFLLHGGQYSGKELLALVDGNKQQRRSWECRAHLCPGVGEGHLHTIWAGHKGQAARGPALPAAPPRSPTQPSRVSPGGPVVPMTPQASLPPHPPSETARLQLGPASALCSLRDCQSGAVTRGAPGSPGARFIVHPGAGDHSTPAHRAP